MSAVARGVGRKRRYAVDATHASPIALHCCPKHGRPPWRTESFGPRRSIPAQPARLRGRSARAVRARGLETPMEFTSWMAGLLRRAAGLGPYVLIEILLPGGTLFA